MRETLRSVLQTIGITTPIKEVKKLHGDASYRTYSRIILDDGTTLIAMLLPQGKSSASEEITNFKGAVDELPFINIARFLKSRGIAVPKVHTYDTHCRIMILEDVGDDLLAHHVTTANYEKAVDLLVELQRKTRDAPRETCVALQRSFDATLLNWEFEHFLEYGLEARGVKLSTSDRTLFTRETRKITEAITAFPSCFTHRDFQSRNIVMRDHRFILLDFQDALVGPAVYDLVALTRDSYVELSTPLVEHLIARYAKGVGREVDDVRREHRLVTVQRKLKDAGRFVYIDRVKKNPNFLPYIPTSLGYVRHALRHLSDESAFLRLLERVIPEWQ